MPSPIKRTGKSSGGAKGKVGTSNLYSRKGSRKGVSKIKRQA